MRILLFALAGMTLIVVACGSEKSELARATPESRSTAAASTGPEAVITTDATQLVLPADQMIAGTFTPRDGSIATLQWSRSWERDPADPGAATGATYVTITVATDASVADGITDFANAYGPVAGASYAQSAIEVRGFAKQDTKIAPVTLGVTGPDEQTAWRAEFGRGASQTFVQYFVFMRVRNVLAAITTFAPTVAGAEPPNLLDETRQLAKRQADRLLAQPTIPKPN